MLSTYETHIFNDNNFEDSLENAKNTAIEMKISTEFLVKQ